MKKFSVLLALALLTSSALPSLAVAPTHSLVEKKAFPSDAAKKAFFRGQKAADDELATPGNNYYSIDKPQAQTDLQEECDNGGCDSLYAYYLQGFISR